MRTFPVAALKAALLQGSSNDDQMMLSHQANSADREMTAHLERAVGHLRVIEAASSLAARRPHPRP